jgi:hypothetical protein
MGSALQIGGIFMKNVSLAIVSLCLCGMAFGFSASTAWSSTPPNAVLAESKSDNGDKGDDKVSLQPTFNIDFGPDRGTPSKKTGAAAAGQPGDYWNTVAIGFNSNHIETGLKFANGEASPIAVALNNLGGGWGNDDKLGIHDPMMNSFNYPVNNQGGSSLVTLYNVSPGSYDIYVYGHGTDPNYYGDYQVTVGDHDYGRKQTTHGADAVENTKWVEGSQFVRFKDVNVGKDDILMIHIQPGGTVTDRGGRTFADAMICGLQLIPAKSDVASAPPPGKSLQ